MPANRSSWTDEEKATADILLAVTSVLSLEGKMSPEMIAKAPSLPQFIEQAWTIAREVGWVDEDDARSSHSDG
jgi:pantoate kinase